MELESGVLEFCSRYLEYRQRLNPESTGNQVSNNNIENLMGPLVV